MPSHSQKHQCPRCDSRRTKDAGKFIECNECGMAFPNDKWKEPQNDVSSPKSTAQRVREAEASHLARGEREIRLWVPDNPEDIEAVRSLARELCAKRSPKSP